MKSTVLYFPARGNVYVSFSHNTSLNIYNSQKHPPPNILNILTVDQETYPKIQNNADSSRIEGCMCARDLVSVYICVYVRICVCDWKTLSQNNILLSKGPKIRSKIHYLNY